MYNTSSMYEAVDDTTTALNSTAAGLGHRHDHPHVLEHILANSGPVSRILPYSAIILSSWCILLFCLKHYLIEPLSPRWYPQVYKRLSHTDYRSFVNHHVAGGCKIFLVIAAAYPTCAIIFKSKHFQDPLIGHKGTFTSVTTGDWLVAVSQLFCAMYIFELIYRVKVSYISTMHHVGAVLIAQCGMIVALSKGHDHDGNIEFALCLLWGAFDVLAELWPHIAIILYRVYPNNHSFMSTVFLGATCVEFLGTTVETFVVMTLFGLLWDQWSLAFKIATPILHLLFTVAQLNGAKIFLEMWYIQRQRLRGIPKDQCIDIWTARGWFPVRLSWWPSWFLGGSARKGRAGGAGADGAGRGRPGLLRRATSALVPLPRDDGDEAGMTADEAEKGGAKVAAAERSSSLSQSSLSERVTTAARDAGPVRPMVEEQQERRR